MPKNTSSRANANVALKSLKTQAGTSCGLCAHFESIGAIRAIAPTWMSPSNHSKLRQEIGNFLGLVYQQKRIHSHWTI